MAKRKKQQQKYKKKEFSKVILFCVGALTIIVNAFTMQMVWETKDLSPLAYLIPAVFAELGIGTGFYYNKAKAENVLAAKIRAKQNGLDIKEEDLE